MSKKDLGHQGLDRREFIRTGVGAAAAIMATQISPAGAKKRSSKPNIILINCDDLGYGDLGCYGNKRNATPVLDAMAEKGMRFTEFYAGAAWCMPSRKAIMTGIHPYRDGIKAIPALAKKYTLAEMMRDRGYATALIGKWHLGMNKGSHPLDKGFDYFYGTAGSNDWNGPGTNYKHFKESKESDWKTPLYKNNEQMGIIQQSQFTQQYTEQTLSFIRQNKEKKTPFFIYLAHNMPHVPLFPSEKFKGKSKGGIYGDVIEELDWSIGKIFELLRDEELEKDTLVIFTSDNGPWISFMEFGGTAEPLRGEKTSTWEGGPRVPAIFYWPGQIKPVVSDEFMVNIDIFATLATLTQTTLRKDQAYDSIDMSPVIFQNKKSARKNYLFCHDLPGSYRSGDYKIHFSTKERSRDPHTGKNEAPIKHDPPLLFNLKQDISETKNIAGENPQILETLSQEFHQAVKDIVGSTQYR